MKIFIAYKFLNSDINELKALLEDISKIIEDSGHETFIFFRDSQQWGNIDMPFNQIIIDAFAEIFKSDTFLAIVQDQKKSEGLLLEFGYAKALNKKTVLAIKDGISLRFCEALSDIVISYDSISDLKLKITHQFY